ncbi:TPA: hypothetical protein QHU17_004038 [Enterobacter hormaechei subsp. xiangfangensis]|nr:hypothetical protein [Enterobacter hormaechei subsp. xiangfangensis]
MKSNAQKLKPDPTHSIDLDRTSRFKKYYWEEDILVRRYIASDFPMKTALSKLNYHLRESFKESVIEFLNNGNYSQSGYFRLLTALRAALNANPTDDFSIQWFSQALKRPGFHKCLSVIKNFFIFWNMRNSSAISREALYLLIKTEPCRTTNRNVLSDDPEKSWLTEREYDSLLHTIWNNYDKEISDTQTTLIKILSMQYARRPIQLANLKNGDIQYSNISSSGKTGHYIHFPGTKDLHSITGFRDSKVETHPLSEHIENLFLIHFKNTRKMYEHVLNIILTDEQFSKLPCFSTQEHFRFAIDLLKKDHPYDTYDHLEHKILHLPAEKLSKIIRWQNNLESPEQLALYSGMVRVPTPPVSHRTQRNIVITATRLRHTRARQLARMDIPRYVLSHWLGHTNEKSLSAYYNDPAEESRKLDEAMAHILSPIAMSFTGKLIDSRDEFDTLITGSNNLEHSKNGELKNVGLCGKHSFCATTSVPVPCYRCKDFRPLISAPHQEVLDALLQRQQAEKESLKVDGLRNILLPIDLSQDIRAVQQCIELCNLRKAELDQEK